MNMLAFDPIKAMSCGFLRVSQYLQKCIKSNTVVRLGGEAVQHQTKDLDKLEARRGGTPNRKTITVK